MGSKYKELEGLKGREYRNMWNKIHRKECKEHAKRWRAKRTPTYKRLRKRQIERRKANGKHQELMQRYYTSHKKPTFSGARWCETEDVIVLAKNLSDREIANKLGRSIKAIEMRRLKLKKKEGN